jgi:hypothetical protein
MSNKGEFVLDLHTGKIYGVTEYMRSDVEGSIRLKGRFIPWTTPIPPGGMIDLQEWQKEKSKEIQSFQKDIASQIPQAQDKPSLPQDAPLVDGGVSIPIVVTEADRLSLIMRGMTKLSSADMTKDGVPTVAALNKYSGLQDISGPEREATFAAFKTVNPNWKPIQVQGTTTPAPVATPAPAVTETPATPPA